MHPFSFFWSVVCGTAESVLLPSYLWYVHGCEKVSSARRTVSGVCVLKVWKGFVAARNLKRFLHAFVLGLALSTGHIYGYLL